MRGEGGVASEGSVVGVPMFHSWDKCTMPLTNINSDWMFNLTLACVLFIKLVIDRTGTYLCEIRELEEQTGTTVDSSTICRFLHNSGFTRRKLSLTAKQRSDTLQA